MDTPIFNFVKKYADSKPLRLHMPGHKGKGFLGCENLDVTEFDGADDLFNPNGIIQKSEQNASEIFSADTFYSTEGSSLCIRTMLYLLCKYATLNGIKPLILAGRNAHKSFISAVALLDVDVEWWHAQDSSYLSCNIIASDLREYLLNSERLPFALYLTSPDYLGNTVDIKGIKEVCKEFNILLIVDNAHGAYLKFLENSLHPIDFGADMCCDSAHKTLPALTGAGYLHINKNAPSFFKNNAKSAMSLFASTSPSYLILQSLDLLNLYLAKEYKHHLANFVNSVNELKSSLKKHGYKLIGNEPLKICIQTSAFGYNGFEFNKLLSKNGIVCEFFDNDFVVFMLTPETDKSQLQILESTLLSIEKSNSLLLPPKAVKPKKAMRIRDAVLSASEKLPTEKAVNRVLASVSVSCPPAVPIIVSGEIIDKQIIDLLKYYNIEQVEVVK